MPFKKKKRKKIKISKEMLLKSKKLNLNTLPKMKDLTSIKTGKNIQVKMKSQRMRKNLKRKIILKVKEITQLNKKST